MLSLIWGVLSVLPLQAQTEERYIEVTGTSEIEIVPDKIIISLKLGSILKKSSMVNQNRRIIVLKCR